MSMVSHTSVQPFLTYMLILIPLLQVFSTTFCTTVQKMRIKTYLRSTMSEQRLNDLAVLSIERDVSSQLSLERVVDKFVDLDKNRRIVLS